MNADYDVCNWLTRRQGQDRLCVACRHNDTIPDNSQASHLAAWRDIELAKYRPFYSLLRWSCRSRPAPRTRTTAWRSSFWPILPTLPGPKCDWNDDGVVTIALAEADSAEIERRRAELAEPIEPARPFPARGWAPLLGHPRSRREQARTVPRDIWRRFTGLPAARKCYYDRVRPRIGRSALGLRDLTSRGRISPRPGRLFLHIVDTLETASAFGLRIAPSVDKEGAHFANLLDFDPYAVGSIERIVDAWAPFVVAMNSVNRAMGMPDLYPFVIAPAVVLVEKLRFIHDLVRGAAKSTTSATGSESRLRAPFRADASGTLMYPPSAYKQFPLVDRTASWVGSAQNEPNWGKRGLWLSVIAGRSAPNSTRKRGPSWRPVLTSAASSGAASARDPDRETLVYLRTALDPAPVVTKRRRISRPSRSGDGAGSGATASVRATSSPSSRPT